MLSLLLLLPVWGFEVLYHLGMRRSHAVPVVQGSDVPRLAQDALWVVTGGAGNEDVPVLWVGSYFDLPEQDGRHAAGPAHRLATLWALKGPDRNRKNLESHLIRGSLAVWFSRHMDAAEMKQALVEWEDFGCGAFGVRAAARAYFDVEPEALSVAQIALLAGLPQSPRRLDPSRFGARAARRRAYVLGRMFDEGLITQAEQVTAFAEPIAVVPAAAKCP